jgi:phospholipid/cholesterol/gamma-HCH transport system substrate-binding protein
VSDIREALANIRDITGEVREGRGNLGRSVYDDRLYESVLATAQKAEDAAEKLKEALDSINSLAKNMDGVVSGAGEIVEKAVGLGVQVDTNARYDFIAGQARASASLRLEPGSGDRWYRIGVSSTPDGISTRTVKETTGAGGVISREDTTETRYSVAFDMELARRFGMLTLRGGLLENSAGFGLDIQPLRWAALSGELFHFKDGSVPNFRSSITFYPFFDPDSNKPWNWLYFRGGVNNALSGSRDFFIGGGLRFADREVKGLVGLAPALNQ